MDYLYGGLAPEHATVVAGIFIPTMPAKWQPYESTLRLMLNFRPWVEVVVFTQSADVKAAALGVGAHCVSDYKLVRALSARRRPPCACALVPVA